MKLEDAYKIIVLGALKSRTVDDFDEIEVNYELYYGRNLSCGFYEIINNQKSIFAIIKEYDDETDAAATFIRDYLWKQTGDRIWNIKATILPNGKYNFEFGYDVPEFYDVEDEEATISLDDALRGLENIIEESKKR